MAQSSEANLNQSWLLVFIQATRRHWLLIVICAAVFGALATVYAVSSPIVYRTQVVLIPKSDSTESNSVLDNLGGLAGLVGAEGQTSRKAEALAILRSRQFTEMFIEKFSLRDVLFADTVIEDPDDATVYDAYLLFDQDIRKISENLAEGTVTVAIEWTDRNQAAEWANQLVAELNQGMRARAINEYDRTLEYLQKELGQTTEIGVRQGLYNLIEENTRAIALANVQVEYAFSVVDSAAPPDPDAYFKPQRPAIVLSGLLVGLIAGLLVAMLRYVIAAATKAQ